MGICTYKKPEDLPNNYWCILSSSQPAMKLSCISSANPAPVDCILTVVIIDQSNCLQQIAGNIHSQ